MREFAAEFDDLATLFDQKLRRLVLDMLWRCDAVEMDPVHFNAMMIRGLLMHAAQIAAATTAEKHDGDFLAIMHRLLHEARHLRGAGKS